jgi:hypothetical protein
MATLSWNEIRHRAISFARDWKGEGSEKSERQTFWNEFFEVFGRKRRQIAAFEEPVKKLSGNWGFIDLFWPGQMIVEHKSAGADLGKAHAQAMDYIRGLIDSSREKELPRWLIVSDFARIAIHDLEPEQDPDLPLFNRLPASVEFPLSELHKHIRHFSFLAGYRQRKVNPEDPANFEATEIMARLHDALYDGGYRGHDLCRFLVRLLFCFFADDSGIFPPDAFKLYLQDHTVEDGSDLGPKLARFFDVLNTPEDIRSPNLDEDLAQFPYVNGDLFAERLAFTDFTSDMRSRLMEAVDFSWERISPAVFGSLFQTVFDHQDNRKRRQIGAHYTSEQNIMKVIRPLFLDDLRSEFEAMKNDKSGRRIGRLRELQKKLASLRFLDPACGCGNFLAITYREIRQLELEILLAIHGKQHSFSADDILNLSMIDVDQMYGIELEEYPARIAEVAIWLADHQANVLFSEAFGQFYKRIPLRKSPHIHVGNALRINWNTIIPSVQCSYVLGNPPFIGKKEQNAEQKKDFELVWGKKSGTGILDYVTCWYAKAAAYIKDTQILCGFVSTNSISQGQQVGVLWSELWKIAALNIHFAHRTFEWQSEARGRAHVHVVIIGFGVPKPQYPTLYEYETVRAEPSIVTATNINPYLTDAPNVLVKSRRSSLNAPLRMRYGSMMIDKERKVKGHKAKDDEGFLLTREHRNAILKACPDMAPYIHSIFGGDEYINGEEKWCLWLVNTPPEIIGRCDLVLHRIVGVRQFRTNSKRAQTIKLAKCPTLFGEIRQPKKRYLIVPKVSSISRNYIPIGFVDPNIIASGSALVIEGAGLFEFGVLSSAMHNAWLRYVGGRTKSDPQYSNEIVYNNFPWPSSPTQEQHVAVEKGVEAVLDARKENVLSTLADLYNPLTMPPSLSSAHTTLDRAVERCYRKEPFPNNRTRVEYLFTLYEKLTAPLVSNVKKKRKV